MKKVLFSLLFIVLLMSPALAAAKLDSVSISADVSSNGKATVTDVIQLTFDTVQNDVVIPLPEGDLSNISVGDMRYSIRRSDGSTDVVVSRTGGFGGAQTFVITYTVDAELDSGTDGDVFALNLLSSRWAKEVGSCSFHITMPASYTPLEEDFRLEPEILSGYYGALPPEETGLSVNGTVIEGAVTQRMSYDSLAMSVAVPKGYFFIRSATIPVISMTWLAFALLILLMLCIVYWWFKIRNRSQEISARLLPPEGLLPCQLPQALDGSTCDIAAQILEWANLGYLSIQVTRKGQVVLTRNILMGSERSRAEQRLFRHIFAGGVRVVATAGRFSRGAARFRAASRKALNRITFDRRGGNTALISLPCRLMAAVGIGYLTYEALPGGGGFVIVAVLAGIAGFLYSILLHSALVETAALGTGKAKTFLLLAVAVLLMIGALLAGTIPETGFGLLACLFSGIATAPGPRRSERGRDIMAQTRGCLTFYQRVTWQRLQRCCGRDPRFFQNHLPRVVAFGVEKSFAARFERLNVPQPEWLQGVQLNSNNAVKLQKQVTRIVKVLREAFK